MSCYTRFAGGAITVLLGALESFRVHGDHGDALFLCDRAADRFHIVADHADDAGGINKRGLGLVRVDQFTQAGAKFFLAAVDDIHLAEIGGETIAVQLRSAGERAADVPGIGGAADRPMDDVQRIGDRIEHHARTAKDAGALADGTGRAFLVARNPALAFPFAEDLPSLLG